MKTNRAFYVGTHHYSFRNGEPAEILGVETCFPENHEATICFHIIYHDGKEDWCPVSDVENYKLLREDQVIKAYKEKE